MNAQHTPGPWKVAKPRKSHANGKLMYGLDGPECVSDYEDWGFTEANARLIAAAPELLEALKSILAVKPQHGMNPHATGSDPMEVKVGWNVHMIARAAIAKATGGGV